VHANARLTVYGRAELVRRVVVEGRPVAHVVAELGCSRATGYKWLARWRAEGSVGLVDRSSRAHRLPAKTAPAVEARVLALRTGRKLGPARIGPLLGMPASTVDAVLGTAPGWVDSLPVRLWPRWKDQHRACPVPAGVPT
jgi:transposase-like protein